MRVPSGVGSIAPHQKPAINKVAEHINDVVTVATSIDSGQLGTVVDGLPHVKTVALGIKEVKQVAGVEQYVRMLAQDLSNIDLVGSQLAGVLNVSNNMAVVLLLHSRMADLLDIKKSLVHIDAVALNEEHINRVFEAIPEITTLVSHMDSLVRMAQVLPQLEAVFENLDAIFLIGSNVGHIVNVSTNMDTILEASTYVEELYTLIEQIKESEAHIAELEASTEANAQVSGQKVVEAAAHALEAKNQATVATTKASEAKGSATQAASSATAADTSQKKATTSEGNAKASETSAANSAAAALASKNSAQAAIDTVNSVKAEVVAAGTAVAADKAVVVSTAATVATHRDEVASNAAKVVTDKGLVETAKTAAMNAATLAETRAQVATTKAAEAAESAKTAGELVTGVLQDAGSFESTGTLPQPPVAGGIKRSAMWKVTVAGTSGGIELAVGDTLVYTAGSDSYYKIDNTESVTSVQNRRGAVVITAADVGLGSVNNTADSTKNVLSATKLTTARTIGGVSFDGTSNINLPGVNTAGNQDTSGNAATTTKLATARTINGVSFDGTANITVADSTKVPTSRTVNGKALTGDIALSASDVGAATPQDIADSSVPFPDVWIPFNDSLRMLAGYGDDIKVGDYTVATQASFSRASTATYIDKSGVLRTAAINEPRFEKEGLLIEGQSTNLAPWSMPVYNQYPQNGSHTLTSDASDFPAGFSESRVMTPTAVSGGFQIKITTVAGAQYTVSMWLKGDVGLKVLVAYGSHTTGSVSITIDSSDWKRYTAVVNTTADSSSAWVGGVVLQGDPGGRSVKFAGVQVEALPFATSYIPTNGAAATRAGDGCSVPSSGNVPSDFNMTFSASIDLLGKGINAWPRIFEINRGENKGPYIVSSTGSWGGVDIIGRMVLAARYSDMLYFSAGVMSSQFEAYTSISNTSHICGIAGNTSRAFFGHIHNFRIWHTALTDAQIKGLK